MQLNLSLINTIHVKQQHNVCFFIFKVTLKYMFGNVYINKIHALGNVHIEWVYIIEKVFVVSKGILHIKFQKS